MPNRLATETSPYLLQHADNPVDWWPWGAAAFAAARDSGKPILLSIGYAACHWCHVMAHESFENPVIAEVMNRLFINIKVDREERPDVDQIYMAALHGLGEQGGWPLTMFLTPDGAPFWGGTYFPPSPRYGRPGFGDVLETMARLVKDGDPRVATNRKALLAHLERQSQPSADAATPTPDMLRIATERLLTLMDPDNGGLRGAPKFPQPGLLELFFIEGARSGNSDAVAASCFALERMSEGGIYDHLGGGYARYSVDDRWLVPHFEKMLYDNAELLRLLGRANWLTGNQLFRDRIDETMDWLYREMRLDGGAFAASLDADTEGHEGATYVWSEAEIDALLGEDAAAFKVIYDVTAEGNFEGSTILNRLRPTAPKTTVDRTRLGDMRRTLLQARSGRPQPARDDKILADWNGLMIRALASLQWPEAVDMARTAYRFVAESMSESSGRLAHSTRAGRFSRPGLASDHAAMALAALELFKVTQDAAYLADACRWLHILEQHYAMGNGLYYLAADDCDDLILRPSSLNDEAYPNYHALIARALVDVHLLTGDPTYLLRADRLFDAAGPTMARSPLATASLYVAFAARLDLSCVVIVGPPSEQRDAFAATLRDLLRDAVHFVTESTDGLGELHPARGKRAIKERPTAYICNHLGCQPPVTDPSALFGV